MNLNFPSSLTSEWFLQGCSPFCRLVALSTVKHFLLKKWLYICLVSCFTVQEVQNKLTLGTLQAKSNRNSVFFSLYVTPCQKCSAGLYQFYIAMANRILFTGFQVPELKKFLQDHSISNSIGSKLNLVHQC